MDDGREGIVYQTAAINWIPITGHIKLGELMFEEESLKQKLSSVQRRKEWLSGLVELED